MSLKNSLEKLRAAIQRNASPEGIKNPCPPKTCYVNLAVNEGVHCMRNTVYYQPEFGGGCRLYTTSTELESNSPCNKTMHTPMCNG